LIPHISNEVKKEIAELEALLAGAAQVKYIL
jgi:hypothetical protein